MKTAAINQQQTAMPTQGLGKTPTMTRVEVVINAPIEKVWAEFADIGNIYLSSPTVQKSYLSSEIKTGVGATRHMHMSKQVKEGATLDERVIEWEEGSYQKLEVYQLHKVAGIKTMGGDFRLIAQGDKTLLKSSFYYSMSNSIWGFMNKLVGKYKFADLWRSVLVGYKHRIETGEAVTEHTKLDIKQVKIIDIVISKA